MSGQNYLQRMEQLPWDGVFSDSALAVFEDRPLPRDLDLSSLFQEPHGGDDDDVRLTLSTEFSAHYAPFSHHHFAFSDTRSTYLTPPPNPAASPGLMPPPPLPSKVQQHRQPGRRRRRSSGLESCGSNMERPASSSSVPATPPGCQQHPVTSSPGSHQTRQYPSPRSPDGQPTHQSPEEFLSAVQTQDSSTTEASDTLFKDWMHAYYTSSSLPRALTNEDEDEDEDDYSGSNESPASSYNSLETREGSRKRIHVTGEFLQWGSDSNFGDVKRHYTPGPLKETVESMHEFQLMTLKCLLVNQSEDMGAEWDNELSEPPKLPTNSTPGYKIVFKTQIPPIKSEKDQKDDTLKAVRYKRRKIHGATKQHLKGTMTARETENEIDGMTEMSPTAPSEARRRRRRNREVKDWPMRSILSEEQRRQNHIKSEKKRRILINEGFDDLCSLVPSLGKGKFCKSTVLQLAGQWLEVLIEGNEVLEKQLAELKEQEDSS